MEAFRCMLPKIFFGNGETKQVGVLGGSLGKKAFLAIDPYLDKSAMGREIRQVLREASIQVVSYSEIDPDPDASGVDAASAIARDGGSDLVIAVGGGSALDFGKGVAVLARNPGTCWDYTRRRDHTARVPGDATLPVVAVPTTAGTGSEMTPFAVFTHRQLAEKSTIASEKIVPRIAIIDPELTHSCPPRLTALTGVDALAHGIEAYINVHASPFAKMVGIEAIRLAYAHLRDAVNDGSSRPAREKMAWASALAGMAISHSNPTLPHALGQAAGGMTHARHGDSVAACLAAVMRLSFSSDIKSFSEIAVAMDPSVGGLPPYKLAERSAMLVEKLLEEIDLRVRFGDLGLREGDIERAAEIALTGYYTGISSHPKAVDASEIKQILRKCL